MIVFYILSTRPLIAQQLDSIIPITCSQCKLPDSISFILTASDYNLWRGQPVKYASSIQIIDGAKPWPPRWFATAPIDTNLRKSKQHGIPVINAFEQNQEIIFTNAIFKDYGNGNGGMQEAVLMCNRQMELVDTFYRPGQEVDGHDFAINAEGERLYFLSADTVLDMHGFFSNAADSQVLITYEKIQITNKKGEIIFSWNPIERFGLGAMYKPYIYEKSVMNNRVNLGWSHGNSLCWDNDGNILYSYKYIGIGKISRRDGHFMWRVDRNHQKPSPGSDSLPIFLQHDLKAIKGVNNKNIYSVLSNGDSLHPFCAAYRFTIVEDNKEPNLRIVKKFSAPDNIPQTGAGNYDVEEAGNYLINYGIYKGDTSIEHILFEYREKDDNLLARYMVMPLGFCYRVHKMDTWAPPRPKIIVKGAQLSSTDNNIRGTWYHLSGKDLKTVTKVGAGNKYRPLENGYYCLAVKYGIGYAVSEPLNFLR
jgi:hypothetical protein